MHSHKVYFKGNLSLCYPIYSTFNITLFFCLQDSYSSPDILCAAVKWYMTLVPCPPSLCDLPRDWGADATASWNSKGSHICCVYRCPHLPLTVQILLRLLHLLAGLDVKTQERFLSFSFASGFKEFLELSKYSLPALLHRERPRAKLTAGQERSTGGRRDYNLQYIISDCYLSVPRSEH